ncbi:MAG TPA: HAD family hydrolase [Thermomicrobiales bacterium]|nr:HAD family hydrolase [Thermomicrobiales bacterium]
MTVAAVLFDLDDTLVADAAATEAAFLAACAPARARHGLDPATLTAAVRRHARRLWQAAPTSGYCRAIGISSTEGLRAGFAGDDPHLAALRAWAPTYRDEAWSAALAGCGVRDAALAEELATAFIAERGARHWVFEDVAPALGALGRTHRLALVTNGAPDLQRAKFAGAGLAQFFDAVVVSGEIGAGKPDARPFAVALAALRADPARAVMVGDSPDRDLAGARNAGIAGIWIDRRGSAAVADSPIPEPRIGDLHQLLPLL